MVRELLEEFVEALGDRIVMGFEYYQSLVC
jgi:hypothetical protein